MSSKKNKKKLDGGDIIKNMFGGMDSTTIAKLTLANTILLSLFIFLSLLGVVNIFTILSIPWIVETVFKNDQELKEILLELIPKKP